ncbi:hypothetical protein AVEN_253385-1 [Araneus ventricosus]|uniref:Uncharacterized protein n=1 Tax=Araneus ventricosus TaxID=182803 RepID=A0A4Y2QW18_ARAVE|nr:hypothetical protein AVEN_253385-1 [Araneus ventricosus]
MRLSGREPFRLVDKGPKDATLQLLNSHSGLESSVTADACAPYIYLLFLHCSPSQISPSLDCGAINSYPPSSANSRFIRCLKFSFGSQNPKIKLKQIVASAQKTAPDFWKPSKKQFPPPSPFCKNVLYRTLYQFSRHLSSQAQKRTMNAMLNSL